MTGGKYCITRNTSRRIHMIGPLRRCICANERSSGREAEGVRQGCKDVGTSMTESEGKIWRGILVSWPSGTAMEEER